MSARTIAVSPTVRIVGEHPEYRIEILKPKGEVPKGFRDRVKQTDRAPTWETMGYYPSVTVAIRVCVDRGLLVDGDSASVGEYVARVEAAAARIVAAHAEARGAA